MINYSMRVALLLLFFAMSMPIQCEIKNWQDFKLHKLKLRAGSSCSASEHDYTGPEQGHRMISAALSQRLAAGHWAKMSVLYGLYLMFYRRK